MFTQTAWASPKMRHCRGWLGAFFTSSSGQKDISGRQPTLSENTSEEIERLTTASLLELHGQDVIERVTIIRAYVRLLAIDPARNNDDHPKLTRALLDLSSLAIRHGKTELTRDLEALVTVIDKDWLDCM